MFRIHMLVITASIFGLLFAESAPATDRLQHQLSPILDIHPDQTGAYVLEKGEEALLARAWLADHASKNINVQYFIWSSDNIGTLAAESLLRAADRGVHVRVLVDDLLVDAADQFLLALVAHPNISIKVYNPQHKVGVSKGKRLWNVFSNFRASNQRMHDKTFVVDGQVAITGGRNMAAEYFDYNQKYNFRDRDILLIGSAAADINTSFERFWQSVLTRPIETLLADVNPPTESQVSQAYTDLHEYAQDEKNFELEVRHSLENLPEKFDQLVENLVWDKIRFISDMPGKNDGEQGLGGGGQSTSQLAEALGRAKHRVTIQSPYLVLPEGGLELFAGLIKRGVSVRISTNSLLSTDNLQAFSGYSKQREDLLASGIEVYEFKPAPAVQKRLIERYAQLEKKAPIFAIHAKTLVIDGERVFIGTFNLDPRSANLNTEVGVIIDSEKLAYQVEASIETDMQPENSWNSATDNPNRFAPLTKRLLLEFWKLLPLKNIL